MDDMLMLRCKYCGAPIDKSELESSSPYITCGSCGTSQQRVDAKAYLDQMMGQIQSWISKSIPGGFSLSQSENVDSIARFNIFNNNIRPKIELEFGEYKFATNTLLGSPLIVLPFTTDTGIEVGHQSSKAFEFNAKMKSIEPLAVDQESKDLVMAAEGTANAYALLINNVKLLKEDKPGRYILLRNNFIEAERAYRSVKGGAPIADRFLALMELCTGCEALLNGDAMGSIVNFEKGAEILTKVKDATLNDISLSLMIQAVDMELSMAKILKDIASFVLNGNGDPLEVLSMIQRMFQLSGAGAGGYKLGNKDRFNEVFDNLSHVMSAKNGNGNLLIAKGAGGYLMPFWDVDLRYSFQTGSLWAKKSVEVTEDVLVCADFIVDPECSRDPSIGLTDIFRLRPESKILDGVLGKETSISGGVGIGRLSDTASLSSPVSRKVIVPLTTKAEARKLVSNYISTRMSRDSKLKLSNPVVKALIYVPCDIDGNVRLPSEFGALMPQRVLRLNKSELIIV